MASEVKKNAQSFEINSSEFPLNKLLHLFISAFLITHELNDDAILLLLLSIANSVIH